MLLNGLTESEMESLETSTMLQVDPDSELDFWSLSEPALDGDETFSDNCSTIMALLRKTKEAVRLNGLPCFMQVSVIWLDLRRRFGTTGQHSVSISHSR